MTLATKNNAIIVKDGKLAEDCGCCGDWWCYIGSCYCKLTDAQPASLSLTLNLTTQPTWILNSNDGQPRNTAFNSVAWERMQRYFNKTFSVPYAAQSSTSTLRRYVLPFAPDEDANNQVTRVEVEVSYSAVQADQNGVFDCCNPVSVLVRGGNNVIDPAIARSWGFILLSPTATTVGAGCATSPAGSTITGSIAASDSANTGLTGNVGTYSITRWY